MPVNPFNLKTAVRDGKVMQGFELQSFSDRGRHSLLVKAPPIRNDYSSKDCVNFPSPSAVFRIKGLIAHDHLFGQKYDQARNAR